MLAVASPAGAGAWIEFEPWVEKYDFVRDYIFADSLNAKVLRKGFAGMHQIEVAPVDVNGDGVDEVFVRFAYRCRRGSCRTSLFQLDDGRWRTTHGGSGQFVSDEWENGYRVLYDLDSALRWNGIDYDRDPTRISVEAHLAIEHRLNPGYVPPESLAELAQQMAGTPQVKSVMMHPEVWPELSRLLGPNRADFIRSVHLRDPVEVSGPFMLASAGQTHRVPWSAAVAVVDVVSGEVYAATETTTEDDDTLSRTVMVYTERIHYAELPAPLRAWIKLRQGGFANEVFLVRPVGEVAIAE
jgi:hypothetical protein